MFDVGDGYNKIHKVWHMMNMKPFLPAMAAHGSFLGVRFDFGFPRSRIFSLLAEGTARWKFHVSEQKLRIEISRQRAIQQTAQTIQGILKLSKYLI